MSNYPVEPLDVHHITVSTMPTPTRITVGTITADHISVYGEES